jgi:hypothetical protein
VDVITLQTGQMLTSGAVDMLTCIMTTHYHDSSDAARITTATSTSLTDIGRSDDGAKAIKIHCPNLVDSSKSILVAPIHYGTNHWIVISAAIKDSIAYIYDSARTSISAEMKDHAQTFPARIEPHAHGESKKQPTYS